MALLGSNSTQTAPNNCLLNDPFAEGSLRVSYKAVLKVLLRAAVSQSSTG